MIFDRRELLHKLITAEGDLDAIAKGLSGFGWDSENELATFRKEDAKRMIERYLRHSVDETFVENWANLIEGRDDISVEAIGQEILKDFLFEMANPLLTEMLSMERATVWLERLS